MCRETIPGRCKQVLHAIKLDGLLLVAIRVFLFDDPGPDIHTCRHPAARRLPPDTEDLRHLDDLGPALPAVTAQAIVAEPGGDDAGLNFPRQAGPDAMASAYKKAAMRLHPDHGGSSEALSALSRSYARAKEALRV